MSEPRPPVERAVLDALRFSAYDLATRDKLPVIRDLMRPEGGGLAMDIGSGTGYTTYAVFGQRPTVAVDVAVDNLRWFRERVAAVPGARPPLCVVALATALPFKDGAVRFALCSEVLEHLDEDGRAVAEIGRVLAADGRVVFTVPYTGLGFTSFLERLGIPTVHDFPGPERHVRPGYDEGSLAALLAAHGLALERHAYFFRLFTRLTADAVSLAHIVYQRVVHGRRSWTWAEAAGAQGGGVFRLYTWVFPALTAAGSLDALIRRARGFGLVAAARKTAKGRA